MPSKKVKEESLAEQLKWAVIDRFTMYLMLNMASDFEKVLDNPKFQEAINKAKKDME